MCDDADDIRRWLVETRTIQLDDVFCRRKDEASRDSGMTILASNNSFVKVMTEHIVTALRTMSDMKYIQITDDECRHVARSIAADVVKSRHVKKTG